jgi:glycosyltransferase involved in cell wall biosynthesis
MIAYGASIETSMRPDLIARYGVEARDYYLIVSRLIPENSLELMLEGFRQSATKRRLIVVGGANYRDAFHRRLGELAHGDERIRFTGQLTDQEIAKCLATPADSSRTTRVQWLRSSTSWIATRHSSRASARPERNVWPSDTRGKAWSMPMSAYSEKRQRRRARARSGRGRP